MDQTAKDSIVARLKEATNVLVTVRNNPSVDELSACIGFTLLLNKIGKRGAAVFSGKVPSTLEFLQPEKTLEKTTDSLRDFIIALDKAKADKLRYKVEDKVVKIFITPYRTHISEKDLDFSQGDFNVDVVVALGVHEKEELDQAIVAHGRILHDATVISVNNKDQGNVGVINWVDVQASSLSEMMVGLGQAFGKDTFDGQMATAFLTGIVAETDRFSNEKTSPVTMSIASMLMAAGANQQLIATKLEEAQPLPLDKDGGVEIENPDEISDEVPAPKKDDGSLKITHDDSAVTDQSEEPEEEAQPAVDEPETELPAPQEESQEPEVEETPEPAEAEAPKDIVNIENPDETPAPPHVSPAKAVGMEDSRPRGVTMQPPQMGGRLTANSEPEHMRLDPSTDPLSTVGSANSPLLSRSAPPALTPLPATDDQSQPASPPQPSVPLPPVPGAAAPNPLAPAQSTSPAEDVSADEHPEEAIEDAREAVDEAIKIGGDPQESLEPIAALGAQPINLDLNHDQSANSPAPAPSPSPFQPPQTLDSQSGVASAALPPNLVPPSMPTDQSGSAGPATPPPPVPPPMMPPLPPTS